MEYLDLTIAKKSRLTESALSAIPGKIFRIEAVLTALDPKMSVAQPVGSIKIDQKVGGKPVVEDKNKSLADKIQENTNEVLVSCSEKIESYHQNDLDKRTTSVGPKGSDTVASNHKPHNVYDGITNVQVVSGLVDRIEPKESGTGSNSKTEHQYDKTTLPSRKESQGNLTWGKPIFSRVTKQGLLALGRGNDEAHHCSGPEKKALPVVLVGTKLQMYVAGKKTVTSKQIRDVKKQRGPASEKIDNKNTVGLEKVVPLVPAKRIKVPTIFSRAAGDGGFKARVVTLGRMQRHNDTDCAIVVAKDKFVRSHNGALDQGVKSTQHYGKQLGKVSMYKTVAYEVSRYLARRI